MILNAQSILREVPVEGEMTIRLLLPNGSLCKQIGIEELMALAEAGHVCARWRGGKVRWAQLTVPPDVAFRGLGETCKIIRDALHGDANQTTQRASQQLPGFVRRHHPSHCGAFAGERFRAYGPVDPDRV